MFEERKFFGTLGNILALGAAGTAGKRGLEIASTFEKINQAEERLGILWDAYLKSDHWAEQNFILSMHIQPAERYIAKLEEQTAFFHDISKFDDYALWLVAAAAVAFLAKSSFPKMQKV